MPEAPLCIEVEKVCLFKSQLKLEGAVYRPLYSFLLKT